MLLGTKVELENRNKFLKCEKCHEISREMQRKYEKLPVSKVSGKFHCPTDLKIPKMASWHIANAKRYFVTVKRLRKMPSLQSYLTVKNIKWQPCFR